MSKPDDSSDRKTIQKALDWAAATPLKMGTKEFEDGIRAMLRNPSASGGPSASREASSSPASLDAQNENFARIRHMGPVE